MIDELKSSIQRAIHRLIEDGTLPEGCPDSVGLERTRDSQHGDFATNVAMTLARSAKRNPRELAGLLIDRLEHPARVEKVEIAGPGFINFFVHGSHWQEVVQRILDQGESYGLAEKNSGDSILLEFVSANPTGPLHVGHGRGAAYGASLGNLLEAAGHRVHREYYVNDMGRQMDILAASTTIRALEQQGASIEFPVNGYRGDYVLDIAHALLAQQPDWLPPANTIDFSSLPEDGEETKEQFIDALIDLLRASLGKERFLDIQHFALNSILEDIRQDLGEFGVSYDEWFSERGLGSSGRIQEELDRLGQAGHLFEENGALWFRSTTFGDDKDRVLRRDNGQSTYFASDVAYHMDKFARGFDRCVNIWGADHHGYIPRVRAAMQALHDKPPMLQIHLVQFANLYRGEERVPMSTRSGSFVTLRDLRAEVGTDAARFFYVMRKSDQHMDFDLELAKSQSRDNPVYYIQYAHARVCRLMEKLTEQGLNWDMADGLGSLDLLGEDLEQELLTKLEEYPQMVARAAEQAAPHSVANYLRELSGRFHVWYNAHRALVDDPALRNARIALCLAVRQVIANGLTLLGVSAPERM